MVKSLFGEKSLRNGARSQLELNKFLIHKFLKSVLAKYSLLLQPSPPGNDLASLCRIFEGILIRVRGNRAQFKKVCCIIIKFLECCHNEYNYMQFLKHDLKRLLVTAFVLSVPNNGTDEAERSIIRDKIYTCYSNVTGLKEEEIINCCSITRPILIRRSREQYKAIRYKQMKDARRERDPRIIQLTNDMNEDTATMSDLALHNFLEPFDITSTFTFTKRNNIGTSAPASLSASMMLNMSRTDPTDPWNGSTGAPPSSEYYNNTDGSVSNEYVLGTEIQRFNEITKKLIQSNFNVQ
ncbi:hypothetical protein J7295_04601 [Nakaseomyces glabratus]|nr:hypothetical protein J7298_04640 [Nakaseomyces glabratus]KAH7594272.1 hypothetical protein J7295_04601 [Nakaseomyces glabratus]KAH7611460.1 hypothetical protein J7292_04610 [Nakaseomyces glabratus]